LLAPPAMPCKPAHHTISHSDERESQNSELSKTTPSPNVSTLLTTTSLDAQEREGSMVKLKKIFKIQILRKAPFH
jgi:hypothetical protein